MSRFALMFVFVFYFQGAQGDDAVTAGIKLTPMADRHARRQPAGRHLGRPPRLAHARRRPGCSLSAVGLAAMTTLQVHSPYWQSTLWLALVGIGSGPVQLARTRRR